MSDSIGTRFCARRGVLAILVAPGFLVGAVGDARPCPHHEPLPELLAAEHVGADEQQVGAAEHGDRGAASDVHECLCVDMCTSDAGAELKWGKGEVTAPLRLVDGEFAPAARASHPRPTAALIPDANAPPHVA